MRGMNKVLLIEKKKKGFINKKIYSDLVVKIDDLIKKNTYDCYIFTKFINKNNSFFVNTKQNVSYYVLRKTHFLCWSGSSVSPSI